MNRNQLFETVSPDVRVGRTKFDLSERKLTTFNQGALIPIYVNSDILPGDTFDVTTKFKIRTRTPLAPVLDNCKLDTYWFFVPDRLTWKHTKEFYGDSNPSAWINPQSYEVPHLAISDQSFATTLVGSDDACSVGTLWDYMGLPLISSSDDLSKADVDISVLPFRAYKLIWNTWFRDENLMSPILVDDGDTGSIYDFLADSTSSGSPLQASRIHDLFSSCLPGVQKGASIFVPLISSAAPVITSATDNTAVGPTALRLRDMSSEKIVSEMASPLLYFSGTSGRGQLRASGGTHDTYPSTVADNIEDPHGMQPINLVADLTGVSGVSISNLRLAVASQRILERLARGGSRFEEFLRSFFGIISPDAVLQIPQYLGGQTAIIQNNQVIQTSASSETSDLGSTAAFSLTMDSKKSFVHSFTEPGTLMCLAVARVDRTYEQNIKRMWTRTSFFDRYTPPLAHLSEQPVYKYELNFQPGTNQVLNVFGYNEAWVHYRFGQNGVTGELRPSSNSGSMKHWSYCDSYDSLPSLSAGWMKEGDSNVNQTLAVSSDLSHQFFGDFFFEIYAVRPLPPRSVPGLMDHF